MRLIVREHGAIGVLVLLNLVPVTGVLLGQWQTFELILLYWMENVVIGAFTMLRILVRPYGHLLELLYPLLIAPFFALHYGIFCFIHGSFVISLFGEGQGGFGSEPLLRTTIEAFRTLPWRPRSSR